jgi:hypothetical protein
MTTFSLLFSLVIYSMHTAFYFPRACCNSQFRICKSFSALFVAIFALKQNILLHFYSLFVFSFMNLFRFYICMCIVYMEKDIKDILAVNLIVPKKLFSHQNGHSKAILFSILFLRNLPRIVLFTHFLKLYKEL